MRRCASTRRNDLHHLARCALGLGLVAILTLAAPPAARADDKPTADRLEDVERELRERKADAEALDRKLQGLRKELAGLRHRSVEAAERAQSLETDLVLIETELATYEADEQRHRAADGRNRAALADILGLLQRSRLRPASVLVTGSGRPADTVRARILLRATVPVLAERAKELAGAVAETAALRARIADRRERQAAKREQLDEEIATLDRLAQEKATLLKASAAERERTEEEIDRLSRSARSLRDLIERSPGGDDRVSRITRPSAIRSIAEARGSLLRPVAGPVARRFGDSLPHGDESRGLAFHARPGAPIVAPFDGQVVFAGPFRGYGPILIIAHGDGYHSLVAGFDRIDVAPRQWVLAGEPVGTAAAAASFGQGVYFEFREEGRPINPLPWMAADKRKVDR